MFSSCEFGEIFKDTFFTEHLWTTASEITLILIDASNNVIVTLDHIIIIFVN